VSSGADQLRALFDVLYGSTPAAYASDFPLEESVRRLADAVYAPLIDFGHAPRVVGHASERYVSVHRVVPGMKDSFRPVFTGAFHERNGRVFLRGGYALRDAVKLFMSLWLLLCLALTVTTTSMVFEAGAFSLVPLVPLGLFAVGVLWVWNGRANSRKDIALIGEAITRALAT